MLWGANRGNMSSNIIKTGEKHPIWYKRFKEKNIIDNIKHDDLKGQTKSKFVMQNMNRIAVNVGHGQAYFVGCFMFPSQHNAWAYGINSMGDIDGWKAYVDNELEQLKYLLDIGYIIIYPYTNINKNGHDFSPVALASGIGENIPRHKKLRSLVKALVNYSKRI